ncbi:hypothetical protein, partial [Streptomyces aurantiacus]
MTEHPAASEGGDARISRLPADHERLGVGALRWWEVADALWLTRYHPELLTGDEESAPVRGTGRQEQHQGRATEAEPGTQGTDHPRHPDTDTDAPRPPTDPPAP